MLTLPLSALTLKTTLGSADYQFEGAGPSGTFWESKPAYNGGSYFALSLKTKDRNQSYLETKFEYVGGRRVLESVQPLERKIETFNLFLGWGWLLAGGLSFELGPFGILQYHQLSESSSQAATTEAMSRLGNYFKAGYKQPFRLWAVSLRSVVGIFGWPRRQSALSSLELELERHWPGSPWFITLLGKKGLLQLERDENKVSSLGPTSNAVLLFRQGETDFSIWALTLGYRLP